jgi:hypothetical protein
MSIFSLANLAAESVHHAGGHPHFLKTNSTFSSVIGSTTSFIIGTGSTANTFSSAIQAITNLQEMLRLVYNGDPHNGISNWLLNFFVYGSGGGQTVYIFGARKVLNYRLSHNFTVDRYHRTAGLFGDSKTLATNMGDAHSHIHDVTWTPIGESDKLRHMILPILFSLCLLSWDLVIVWKFKIASTTLGASKDLAGTASLHPSHSGLLMITLLEVFEEGMIQVMEIIERLECTKDTAVNFVNTIEESIKASKKKIADAATALAQAQTLAATNPTTSAAALVASQQQIQTTTQVVNAGQQNALPNAVNNVAAPLTGWEKIKAFFSRGP